MGFPRDTDCISGCPGQVGERPSSRHQRPSPSKTGIRLGSPPFAPRLLYPGAPGPLCLGGGKARQRGRPVWCYFGGSEVLTRQDPTPALARLSPGSGPCFANVGGGGSAWTCLGPTDPDVMDRLPHGPSCIRQLPEGRCLFLLSHQESGAQREGLGLQGAASRGSSRPREESFPGWAAHRAPRPGTELGGSRALCGWRTSELGPEWPAPASSLPLWLPLRPAFPPSRVHFSLT